MICNICGHENDNYQTICSNCNSPLTKGFIMCPFCGKIIDEDTKICPRCNKNIFTKEEKDDFNNTYKVAYSPKYMVKAPLSIPTIILIFIASTLISTYYILNIINNFDGIKRTILSLGLIKSIPYYLTLIVGTILGIFLFIVSIISFIKRILVNKSSSEEELSKRLISLKLIYTITIVSYLISFSSTILIDLINETTILSKYLLAITSSVSLFSFISLIIFLNNAKVRTI